MGPRGGESRPGRLPRRGIQRVQLDILQKRERGEPCRLPYNKGSTSLVSPSMEAVLDILHGRPYRLRGPGQNGLRTNPADSDSPGHPLRNR